MRTGYNPRQRRVTAVRLPVTVVEGYLLGQTPSFVGRRALFIRRLGFVRPCPFQQRFKQSAAAEFFRAALEHLIAHVLAASKLELAGPLKAFTDVRLYDGTSQRVPPRGRKRLLGCTKGKAGTKWVVGDSLRTGLLEHCIGAAETAFEVPLWHQLVRKLEAGARYVFDLGFFEHALFSDAMAAGAHAMLRSVRTHASLRHGVPVHELRPLATLHVARAWARELTDALATSSTRRWAQACNAGADALMRFAYEPKPSRSRWRIAIDLGA